MTFTHDDIQARLIEFLYGELDGAARAAFDAHVAACEACRREVNDFQRTRTTARAVVRAPLAEPVPAGVRARVMEAATRATAERAVAARAPAVTAGVAARGGGTTSRWLAWLRARWTLPLLTTAAAMGALLLFRENLFREARRPLGDSAIEELSRKPEPALTREEAPKSDVTLKRLKAPAEAEGAAAEPERPRGGRSRPVAESVAAADKVRSTFKTDRAGKGSKKEKAPAEAKADGVGFGGGGLGREENKGSLDQLLSKRDSEKSADSAPKDQAAKSARRDRDDMIEGLSSRRSSVKKEDFGAPAKSASRALEAERAEGSEPGFAQPPPPPPPAARTPIATPQAMTTPSPASAPPAPSAPAPRPAAPRAPAPAPSVASAPVASRGAPAAGPSGNARSAESTLAENDSAAASRETKAKKRAKAAEPAPASPAADEAPAEATAGAAPRPAADPAAALVDRAEKLMTARRYAEAAAVYKDLLQRFPQHTAVQTWRRRLSAAQVAAAQERNQSGESGFATPPPPR